MRITLPVYGSFCCGDDVGASIQILGASDMIVIKCENNDQVWGDNGVYSTFGIIEFNTDDLKMEKSNISESIKPCIKFKDMKFTKKTGEEMRDWFYEHYKCFCKE